MISNKSTFEFKENYPSARPQTVEELEALGLAIKPLNFPMKRLTQERK
jgi:hypothetical protein